MYLKLWSRIRRYVVKVAYNRVSAMRANGNTRGVEPDDLIQAAYIAMLNAVKTYNPEKASFLPTWLLFYLRKEFREVTGLRKKPDMLDRCSSLDAESSTDIDDRESWLNSIPDDEDCIADAEDRLYQEQLREAIDKALDEIPERQALIVRRIDLEGKTLNEAGEEIGVTLQRASQLRNQAHRQLRNDKGLRAFLADNTSFYLHVGPNQFNTTHTSSTEALALRRIDLEKIYHRLTEGQA